MEDSHICLVMAFTGLVFYVYIVSQQMGSLDIDFDALLNILFRGKD